MRWIKDPSWGVVDRPAEAEHGGTLYAAHLVSGEILRLDGAAALIARSAVGGATLEEIRGTAAQAFQVPFEDIDEQATSELLNQLRSIGLLRRER